ncbi:MAG: LL-diaminopimelate aminotransferase [Elusimicrobia bacterium RIFOXYB2_FULL_49_7]|nr:MAG: LL-diaminopimelate aminotransferase [Elusimicrobia bacterium RIFOXYB2_FULL_49_7]
MARSNPAFDNLAAGYLFPEIGKRVRAFLAAHPGISVLRLGIGDTTEPLPASVIQGLHWGVEKLAHTDTYTGYQDDSCGMPGMKAALLTRYKRLGITLDVSDIFVSDGAKSDSANLQSIFAPDSIIAFQDPAYPVYVDSNVMAGRGNGKAADNGSYAGFVYMPCHESNGFFPAVPKKKVDVIYLCSPNNPTGAVATHAQLKTFVEYARANKSVIIFDAAYSAYISDPSLPRSIFEIEGAETCAIEINSFSKEAGFTGVRLGWTVVPKTLLCEDGEPGKLHRLWSRRQNTMFNGASNIVQEGGLAVLSEKGQEECKKIITHYMENAHIIKCGLEERGLHVFGGINAPYLWLKTPGSMKSWDFFDKLLSETHVVGTPGSGFGPSGEGYFRLSAFGHREGIEKAVDSIRKNLNL